ncbi:MAG TPA: FAD-dependent oxidoreductase [Thermoplasmata archaeon]|nr:FAD-dependent oxidoreductase [Thermoplasmata archaeon]
MEPWDVAIVGGGILGTSVAYWLAARYDGRFVVLEKERDVALHASRRNTGVVHRPFYLNPAKARIFARAAGISYHLWKKYAATKGLPWYEIGTYEVALEDGQMSHLGAYVGYAAENGMAPSEVELLDRREMARREPNVRCEGALFSRTDTAVDYQAFTESVKADAEALGVRFLTGADATSVLASDSGIEVRVDGANEPVRAGFLIGCAGGSAIDLAHAMGVALEYTDMHFRGEYWTIDAHAADLVRHNVYSVPRHTDLPFLDPHWVIRANGRREIGPNAVPVSGPASYDGLFRPMGPWFAKFFEPPIFNKVRLMLDKDFLSLATQEMWSSVSKEAMLQRVQRFLPGLRLAHLVSPGTAGIRTPVVNRRGGIVKEAIEVPGPHSYHILNYNSPGATGSPAFAAYLVDRLANRGDLDHLKPSPKSGGSWNWDEIAKYMELAG